MGNIFLSPKTAQSIDEKVAKVLSDLGNPEPPLSLNVVRELLRLDKGYYSSTDHGLLREVVHRMRVAGKQIIKRPTILADVIKKRRLHALWLPDGKRILIDRDMPSLKQRWGEAHEIGHSIVPWHEWLSHGDHKRTLSYACEQKIEAEANYAAGRLLFLRGRFAEELQSSTVSFQKLRILGRKYGNSITSTLWRAIESLDIPAFALVSIHPQSPRQNGISPVRYFLRSESFAEAFSDVNEMDLFQMLGGFCFGKRGPIGTEEVLIKSSNNVDHVFLVECFYNHYDALTLGILQKLHAVSVTVNSEPGRDAR